MENVMIDLSLKKLKFKNALRFGDKFTELDLQSMTGLTVVMGENGRGKSTVLDVLSFALTGKPVRKMQPGKLVNNHNGKNLLVVLDLVKGDEDVRIIRGQKPGVCKFYVKKSTDSGDIESEPFDRTLPSTTETSKVIQSYLNLDNDLLKFTVINSTRTPTFFQADSSVQKRVVENLFTFDLLSEISESSKKHRQLLVSKRDTESAALRERQSGFEKHSSLLASARERVGAWEEERASKLEEAKRDLDVLSSVDLLEAESKIREFETAQKELHSIASSHRDSETAVNRAKAAVASASSLLAGLIERAEALEAVDLESAKSVNQIIQQSGEKLAALSSEESSARHQVASEKKEVARISGELEELDDDSCPTCGQRWPDAESRSQEVESLRSALDEAVSRVSFLESQLGKILTESAKLREDTPRRLMTEAEIARAEADAANLESRVAEAETALANAEAELSAATEDLSHSAGDLSKAMESLELAEASLGDIRSESDLRSARDAADRLSKEVLALERAENPHESILRELEKATPEIPDWSGVETMDREIRHREFLESSLNRKDSPVRKIIVSKYVPYLNERMSEYLKALGLQYSVTFTDDLDAEIDDFGISLDPSGLSGGEEERVSMALNWAFRDVYEEINGVRVNFSAIDERLDSGLDAMGAENSMAILTEMCIKRGRDIWLITHRPELEEYADRVVKVTREGKFSKLEIES